VTSQKSAISIPPAGGSLCTRIIVRGILLLVLVSLNLQVAVAQSEKSEDDWQFSLAPLFLWGMGISGSSSIGPATLPLDIQFKDALDSMDAVFTFHFEAQKRDLTLFAEYQYIDLSPSSKTPFGATVDVEFKSKMAELGVTYRVAEFKKTEFQILGGARYVEQDMRVKGVPLPTMPSVKVSENWWDAMVGGRVIHRLSQKWTAFGRVDYGFGGSEGTWNLAGTFNYRFKEWGSVLMGYRWMKFDYSNGSGKDRYEYDAKQRGPLLGLEFHW
jgi:hypothetical protein